MKALAPIDRVIGININVPKMNPPEQIFGKGSANSAKEKPKFDFPTPGGRQFENSERQVTNKEIGSLPFIPSKSEENSEGSNRNGFPVTIERNQTSNDSNNRVESEDNEKNEDIGSSDPTGLELTDEEKQVVEDLKKRDREVKAHEQAHVAAGAGLIRGGPSYTYQTGPDKRRYAIGGEVQIDISPENTPEATIRKMQQVKRAALAPAEPSSQDRAVAQTAAKIEVQARQQLREERTEKRGENMEKLNQTREKNNREIINPYKNSFEEIIEESSSGSYTFTGQGKLQGRA